LLCERRTLSDYKHLQKFANGVRHLPPSQCPERRLRASISRVPPSFWVGPMNLAGTVKALDINRGHSGSFSLETLPVTICRLPSFFQAERTRVQIFGFQAVTVCQRVHRRPQLGALEIGARPVLLPARLGRKMGEPISRFFDVSRLRFLLHIGSPWLSQQAAVPRARPAEPQSSSLDRRTSFPCATNAGGSSVRSTVV